MPFTPEEIQAQVEAEVAQRVAEVQAQEEALEAQRRAHENARAEWENTMFEKFVAKYNALVERGIPEHEAGITARKLTFNGR